MGEIVVILVVALLFFGPSKLPKLGDALGRGIRNFRRATQGLDEPAATAAAAEAPFLPAATAPSRIPPANDASASAAAAARKPQAVDS